MTKRISVAIIGLFCAAALAAGCHLPKMDRFDPVNATVAGVGVSAPVSVVRDANGVAHLQAATDEDLFFGIGYAMAQDRFLMMDALRRAASGRLSELLGSPMRYKDFDLPRFDIALRTLRFEESARKGVADLDPESRRLLAAYTAGVNRYLHDGGDSIAIYHSWKLAPEPWRMEDSFLVADVMGLAEGVSSLFEEYYLERVRREQGDAARDLFVPVYPEDAPIITRDAPWLGGGPDQFSRRLAGALGSNNWAIAGARTASGLPLLANDPHVPDIMVPTFWWHCSLKSPSYDVMGMMFTGLPCFGAATNGKLGWVLTNVMVDYLDIWREKVNPSNPNQYQSADGWKDFGEEPGEIKVRGKKPLPYTMRTTRHGAVIEERLLGWKVPTGPGEVLVLRYVDLDHARFFRGYQAMARANNFQEWLAGDQDCAQGPFAWNHVYADRDGNIAYWATAHFPIRADNQGWIARKGWDPKQDWQGYVPFEDNPHLVNPNKGYLVTANNRIEPIGYPHYITVDYVTPSRATRISELIEQQQSGFTPDDMKRIQYDAIDMSGRKMVPIILADLAGAPERELGEAAAILADWKERGYVADVDSAGTCIYEVFMNGFADLVFADKLNQHTHTGLSYVGILNDGLDKIIDDPDSPWWDRKKTPAIETRRDLVRQRMKETMKYLRGQLGSDPQKWRWGDLSTVRFSPAILPIPGIRDQARGPFPYAGAQESVHANGALLIEPLGFYHWEGPSTHLIIDFVNPRRALFNASAGMGDNDASARYDNLTADWLAGDYRVMSMDEREYREGMMGELVLKP
jgi:penicillin G amidase